MSYFNKLCRGVTRAGRTILGLLPPPARQWQHDARKAFLAQFRDWRVPLSVEHVSGPSELDLQSTDAVIVALVRNGDAHVENFLDYHFDLGVRHVVLIDNGSTDQTIERAKKFDNVTILRSELDFGDYKNHLRKYGLKRFGHGCWCLILDIDERFDFPFSEDIHLEDFLRYLNRKNYSAVVGQMLDLFAEGPLEEWPEDGSELMEQCVWYDNSELTKKDYENWIHQNENAEGVKIKKYEGGVRRKLFNVNATLTKHPLIFGKSNAKISPTSVHKVKNVKLADVTCILYHYKFDKNFDEKCKTAIKKGGYWSDAKQYKKYEKIINEKPNLEIKEPSSEMLKNTEKLVDEGFLVVSGEYQRFVQEQPKRENKKTDRSVRST